ncbi:uncharacterized protein JCM15063_005154 [Sporobolomyces koalae]|uniref:uncharacterized protein n=1 Tax=Sporobolomyces koalae TaxID=500713 RepID=UPI003180EACD
MGSPLLHQHEQQQHLLPSTSPSPDSSRRSSIDAKALQQSASPDPTSTATLTLVTSSTTRHSFLPPWLIILGWIGLSTAVIFFNREILVARQFAYPITLTSIHLAFQTVATRLLHRYTDLISGAIPASHGDYFAVPLKASTEGSSADLASEQIGMSTPTLDREERKQWKKDSVAMTWSRWNREILPIAILFSLSLVLSNWAYLYCSVAFIHILKSISPVAILLAAFAFGTKQFSVKLMLIVLTISAGVGIASAAEVNFHLTGFIIQMVAIAIEATRVTLIQLLLTTPSSSSTGTSTPAAPPTSPMSPLKSLYYFAPICLVLNLCLLVPLEGWTAITEIPRLGWGLVFVNASLTFGLNLSAVMLIGLSSMVLSLSKVVKDVLMVVAPALLLGESLTLTQVVGYGIATAGLMWYKTTST